REPLRLAALAASRLCEIYYFGQDTLATTGAAILSVNMAERAGRQTEVRKQYAQLGYMAGLMRMHALARLYFQKARGGPEEEEPNGIGIARWYESSYEETFGRWARGADVADDAIRRLSATGDQGELQIARTLRGHADYYTGRFAESLPRFEEIRTAARARGNVQYEAWGTYSGARSLIALGRLDEAVEQLRESLRMLQRQEDRASEFICQGLLATVHLYRGELEAAREAADVVLRMAEGKQPAAFMERHGYEGAAMAYLELWRQGEKGARKPAERACGLLAGFGRLIPLALPAALRCAGQARQLRGHPRWARATWTRGLAVGARMGMPYDEALIRLELGSASRSGSPEREEHLRLAEQGFAAMGCVQLARRAQASREG
ncbi:MAG TPA: hypothetical protein VK447_08865, partial [Myxococcaceae bacterium]|nr:hypothetical protein [Myxococcaceae bacterium]